MHRHKKRFISFTAAAMVAAMALSGCIPSDPAEATSQSQSQSRIPAQTAPSDNPAPENPGSENISGSSENEALSKPRFDTETQVPMTPSQNELDLMATPPAPPTGAMPETPGTNTTIAAGAEIDWSNVSDGYVCARYPEETWQKLKVQVIGPEITYAYDLPSGEKWTAFPLSDGEGVYTTRVLQNVQGTKYAILAAATFEANLKDEFGPFLRPNQYVDYEDAPNVIALSNTLAGSLSDPLEKVKAVYDWTTSNLTYDNHLAATVQSGYLPDLEETISTKTGICFDYAALMTAMLRCQGVPTKLVIGYAGTVYHAWVSVWTDETGWIDGVIFFNGQSWQRMDPTFAGNAANKEAMEKYIGDGSNYAAKYLY